MTNQRPVDQSDASILPIEQSDASILNVTNQECEGSFDVERPDPQHADLHRGPHQELAETQGALSLPSARGAAREVGVKEHEKEGGYGSFTYDVGNDTSIFSSSL